MPDCLLLDALHGKAIPRVPVWAMRQAGRWDPEFQALRRSLGFFEFVARPDLAAAASLLPRRFGVDAIILFYDITTLAQAVGVEFAFRPGVGPVPVHPVVTQAAVEQLQAEPSRDCFATVLETLRRVRESLGGALPVLGFAGAPFTLASYCIGTGKDVFRTLAFIREQPAVWQALCERLTRATIVFMRALVAEGVALWQLFDTWAGLLDANEYAQLALPGQQEILRQVRGAPSILFVRECPHLAHLQAAGADALSLGTVHDLAALRRSSPHAVYQGNVDCELLRRGTPAEVARATRDAIRAGGGRRHILNLNHGMDSQTPVDNFRAFVDAAREAEPARSDA